MNEKIEQIPNNEPPDNLSDSIDSKLASSEQNDKKKYKEDKDAFLEHLKVMGYIDESIKRINEAYALSYGIFISIKRDSGKPYFDHLMGVSLILIDECKVEDPEMVIAALFHDAIEDSVVYGDISMAMSDWRETAYPRLSKTFDSNIAKMVITLTRPEVDGVEIKDDKEAHDVYISKLEETKDFRIILIKMADRLHNLRTLSDTSPEKQSRIVKETKEIYFPLFERMQNSFREKSAYLNQSSYLLNEMKTIIENWYREQELKTKA
jgi:(p)ppGpp synthase/HD superfamily hydrolase